MSEQKTTQQPEQELSDSAVRRKLAALQAAGEDPFQQTRFDWDATSAQIKEHFDQMEGRAVKVAGRLMSKRGMGKVSFCDLQDRDAASSCTPARTRWMRRSIRSQEVRHR
ncbi:MAG: hypothetical protein ACLTYN_05540 [Dysosmobacter welbionis]